MSFRFDPVGVVPACLMPFDSSGRMDVSGYRAHLQDLAGVAGVSGVTVNGHAAEVQSLSVDEQHIATLQAVAAIGDRTPVICGIYAETTHVAVQLAKRAAADGAHALLLFPPNSLMFGGNLRPELGAAYIEEIAAATDLPLIVFQYPVTTALYYQIDTLVGLCEKVDRIVAIKDLISDPRLHERQINALHALTRPVNVMTSHSMWLAGSLSMGARGVISGAGSVIADRQVALFNAIRTGNRATSIRLTSEMHLLVEALYGAPYVEWPARMKEILFRFGRFQSNALRAPLKTIGESDWKRMAGLLEQAGLTKDSIYAGDNARAVA
jgi:4-hydroxy-tetrahydrodipicolinate synthase